MADLATLLYQCLREATIHDLHASTPMLSWHGKQFDGCGLISEGGSAFLVRSPTRMFGVTAGHVVDAFVAAQSICDGLLATLGGLQFDLKPRIISRGHAVDVATFHVDERELATIGFRPLESAWPPVMPPNGSLVCLAGWPGHERIVGARVTGGLYLGWGNADVQASRVIRVQVDHGSGPFSPIAGASVPEPGFNFGGISGGPLVLVDLADDGRSLRRRIAGIIVQGIPNYDCIEATPANVLCEDGQVAG
jgi:hypothetical protein